MVVGSMTLKNLGKEASDFHTSFGMPLTEAVVNVLEDNRNLTNEQIKRVVEFANNEAFSREFKRRADGNKLFSFEGGPADPVRVLELTKGSRGDVMKTSSYIRGIDSLNLFDDKSLGDGFEKSASADTNPSTEVRDYHTIKHAVDRIEHELGTAGQRYERAISDLCKEAESLIRSGSQVPDIAEAIYQMSPNDDMTKLALKHLSDRLSHVPVEKTASKKRDLNVVNVNHPLCKAFESMAKEAVDYYSKAGARDELRGTLERADTYLKEVLL